jgi:hypothetical protein
MPTSRTSSSSSGRTTSYFSSTSSPRPHSPLAPPIPPVTNVPYVPPTQTVQVQGPGFFGSMIQGFGLGAGSSIAHNMFEKPKTVIHQGLEAEQKPKYTGPCAKEKEVFDKCIQHRQNLEECERILKDLHACYDENSMGKK